MNRNTQSALIRQAATMASYALEMPKAVDMTRTLRDLKAYTVSLTLVNDDVLKPYGEQTLKFVEATLKYLRYRTEKNLIEARKQRDQLTQMMDAFLKGGE